MSFFSTSNILVHIPLGAGGYDLSWIEAIGTLFGLLCIWYASKEKIMSASLALPNHFCRKAASEPIFPQP